MGLKEYHQKITEIIPFKKMLPLFIIGGMMTVLGIVLIIIEDNKSDKEYFELAIEGKISKTLKESIYVYGKINNEWYEFYSEIEFRANIGDSIVKSSNSYGILIKSKAKKTSEMLNNGTELLRKLRKDEY